MPEGAAVGERVFFGESAEQADAWAENKLQKKKVWESVAEDLRTGDDKVARWKDLVMSVSAGPLTSASFANSPIS